MIMKGAADNGLETQLDIGGELVPVRVRRHPRARRILMRLERTGRAVRVTVPDWVSLQSGVDFASWKSGWIAEHLENRPQPVPFAHGVRIPLRGQMHMIFHVPERRGVVWAEGKDETARICVTGAQEHLPRRLLDWLKQQAKADLTEACRHYAARMGQSFARIFVRDQKSRWGSCSARGNLAFSWRLILAPPEVLDYLAAHEVAHLAELNHSARFWKLVRAHCPHVDRAEEWLSEHGSELHVWGARE